MKRSDVTQLYNIYKLQYLIVLASSVRMMEVEVIEFHRYNIRMLCKFHDHDMGYLQVAFDLDENKSVVMSPGFLMVCTKHKQITLSLHAMFTESFN